MISKPIGIAGLAVAVVAAAGVGSFLAVRSGQTPTQAAAVVEPAPVAGAPGVAPGGVAPEAGTAGAPVHETEAVIPPPEPKAEPVERPKPSPPARPAKAEPVTRPAARPAPPVARPEPPLSQRPTQVASANPTPAPVAPMVPAEPPPPPKPRFEEYVIPADSVIGLSIENSVSSETAKPEDRVNARVTRDVRVNGVVAIPAGTKAQGNVTVVEEGGKFKERARLGVRFHTLVLAGGATVPIQTETVYREGEAMGGKSTAKVGGAAAGGAIIGAILGGGKGAAIGTAIGAGAGTAATAAGPRSKATMLSGSTVTVRLSNPTTVTVEKD